MEKLTPKLRRLVTDNCTLYFFWCPGCSEQHHYNCDCKNGRPNWEYSGDHNSPTFHPSVRYLPPHSQCHFFVINGRIQYLNDCDHKLAGQTVDMVPYPSDEEFY